MKMKMKKNYKTNGKISFLMYFFLLYSQILILEHRLVEFFCE